MKDMDDYVSGKVITDIKLVFYLLKFIKIPVLGSLIEKRVLIRIEKFRPIIINIKRASTLIQESEKCAVGERVCRAMNKDSKFTESVFLDKLAEEMVKAGKAKNVTSEEAINALKKYRGNPIILSKVSGKYMEICRSLPKDCVYYNIEQCGMKCFNRFNDYPLQKNNQLETVDD